MDKAINSVSLVSGSTTLHHSKCTHPIGYLDRILRAAGPFSALLNYRLVPRKVYESAKYFSSLGRAAAAGEIRWTANNSARIFFPVSLKKHAFRSRFRQASLSSCREGSPVARARALALERSIYRSSDRSIARLPTASTPNRAARFAKSRRRIAKTWTKNRGSSRKNFSPASSSTRTEK